METEESRRNAMGALDRRSALLLFFKAILDNLKTIKRELRHEAYSKRELQ